MIIKTVGTSPNTRMVTFRFPGSIWADSVHLVGDFNDWNPSSLPLARSHDDDPDWQLTLELHSGRSYRFRYLLDGTTWCNDHQADDYQPNDYGGCDSVVRT